MRLAIVGTGEVAWKNYLPFLAAQPDVALACWNRTPAKAQEVAREFGAESVASLEAVAGWKPTAVLVLTAETCRHEVAATLLNLGVPRMFFEKPLVAVHGRRGWRSRILSAGATYSASRRPRTVKRRWCSTTGSLRRAAPRGS